jgi:predicted thioesterase
MIALMELAAAKGMRPLLGPGQLSVGVGVDVRHLAATPVGIEVRAVATFLGMEGKLYRFRVQAFDRGGLIGEGEHTRAVVVTDRLVNGAHARNGSVGGERSAWPEGSGA